jgi:hypothetical protein
MRKKKIDRIYDLKQSTQFFYTKPNLVTCYHEYLVGTKINIRHYIKI